MVNLIPNLNLNFFARSTNSNKGNNNKISENSRKLWKNVTYEFNSTCLKLNICDFYTDNNLKYNTHIKENNWKRSNIL